MGVEFAVRISDPNVALLIMKTVNRASESLIDMMQALKPRLSTEEYASLRLGVGSVVGGELANLHRQLLRQHPQFDIHDELGRRDEGGASA